MPLRWRDRRRTRSGQAWTVSADPLQDALWPGTAGSGPFLRRQGPVLVLQQEQDLGLLPGDRVHVHQALAAGGRAAEEFPAEKARFQVISLLTGTGFTTRESEIVLSTRRRRRLARNGWLCYKNQRWRTS